MNFFYRISRNFSFKNLVSLFEGNLQKDVNNPEAIHGMDSSGSGYKFIYRYRDASLPPASHRSYTISVTHEKVYITIESYGNILSKNSLPLGKNKYQSFTDSIAALDIRNREEIKPGGCTGGTTDELDICIGKKLEVKGYIYHCGGESFGNLEGDTAKAVELFRSMIPNLKKRIEASKK